MRVNPTKDPAVDSPRRENCGKGDAIPMDEILGTYKKGTQSGFGDSILEEEILERV